MATYPGRARVPDIDEARPGADGIESSGCDLNLVGDTANATPTSAIAARPEVSASGKAGIAGLKRSAIERKEIAQRLPPEWKG